MSGEEKEQSEESIPIEYAEEPQKIEEEEEGKQEPQKIEKEEEIIKKVISRTKEKESEIEEGKQEVKKVVTEAGSKVIDFLPQIFTDKSKAIKSIKDSIPGGNIGVGLIIFVVVMIIFVLSMAVGIVYLIMSVTAAAFAMKINKDKKGLAKYSKIMKGFALGLPYIVYGSFFYKE